ERLSRRLEDDIGRWGSHEMVLVAWMVRSYCALLAGPDADSTGSEELDELREALDPDRVEARGGSRISVFAAITNRAQISMLMGGYDGAVAWCLRVIHEVERVMLGSWTVPRAALTTIVTASALMLARGVVAPEVHAASRKALTII